MNRLFKIKFLGLLRQNSKQRLACPANDIGAVLVELTYVIVIMILLATSTLELVNFMRHHKMAMSVSYEIANQIFKECPDVERNSLEIDSYRRQTTAATSTPARVTDCLTRSLQQFEPFLAAYAGSSSINDCADPIVPTDILPPYAYVEISNPSNLTSTTQRVVVIASGGADIKTCVETMEIAKLAEPENQAYLALVAPAITRPNVVVRSVVHIPYRGILLSGGFFQQIFSSEDYLRNGGVRAVTII